MLAAPGELRGGADEALQGDVEFFMQPADHFERQAPFPRQDFRHSSASTEDGLQVLTSHAELVHSESDGFDGVRRTHGIMLGFIGFDERREHGG